MSDNTFSTTSSTLQGQMRQAITLARAGDRAGAEAIFDAILAQRPEHEEALVWKAAIVRDPDEAVACLEKALQVNPANRRAMVGLEWAYKRQQESRGDAINMTPFENPQLATLNDDTPANFAPGRQRYAEIEDPNLFRPEYHTKTEQTPGGETIGRSAPYKKRRLENTDSSMNLPPEAVEWTRPGPRRGQSAKTQAQARPDVETSQVFRAASPKIAFSVSPKLGWGKRGRLDSDIEQKLFPLRWPLGLFGLALGLALLTFPFHGAATLLGTIAFGLALGGVFLFNRARL